MTQSSASVTLPVSPHRPGARGEASWRVPAVLVALTAFPLIAGSLRLLEIAGGPQVLPTNPRIDASPAPLVLHVVAAAVYAFVGAFHSLPVSGADTVPGTAEPVECSSGPAWSSPDPASG